MTKNRKIFHCEETKYPKREFNLKIIEDKQITVSRFFGEQKFPRNNNSIK